MTWSVTKLVTENAFGYTPFPNKNDIQPAQTVAFDSIVIDNIFTGKKKSYVFTFNWFQKGLYFRMRATPVVYTYDESLRLKRFNRIY